MTFISRVKLIAFHNMFVGLDGCIAHGHEVNDEGETFVLYAALSHANVSLILSIFILLESAVRVLAGLYNNKRIRKMDNIFPCGDSPKPVALTFAYEETEVVATTQTKRKKRRVREDVMSPSIASLSSSSSSATNNIPGVTPISADCAPNVILSDTDVRYTVCSNFSQHFNLGDPTDFTIFLKKVCLPTCSGVIRTICRSVENNNLYFPEYLELDGIQSINYYWTTTFAAIPDGIFELLKDPKVKNFGDGGSLVSCRFQYRGTQVLKLLTDISSVVMVTNPNDKFGTGILAFQVEGSNRQVREVSPLPSIMLGVRDENFSCSTSLLYSAASCCRSVDVTGTLSFYFNSDQRIYKMETIHD
jgi:hypothetical protein